MLALVAAVMAWGCFQRGPWYDEFYTQFVSRPELPWGTALTGSWLPDNHPPLYYALARASAWLGEIEYHRLLNLGIGALAVAGGIVVVRDVPRLATTGTALVMAVAANHWTMLAGTELRSYFLSLCAGAVLALSLCAIRMTGSGGSRGRRAVYWIAALLAFNTHIVTSLTAAALVAPFLAAALLRRDLTEARIIALPPLVGGLVLCTVAAVQLPYWLGNTTVFWIGEGFAPAYWAMHYAVLRTAEANPLLLAGALAGAALMARDVALRRQPSAEAGALALLVGGGVLAIVGLVALHLLRPLVIEKYLMALVAMEMVGLALAFARMLRALGPRIGALTLAVTAAASIPGLIQSTTSAVMHRSWFASGRAVAAEAALCPGTVIHGGDWWNDDVLALQPQDNARVVPYAYRAVADRLGFRLAPAGSHSLSRNCPTIFWGEHDNKLVFDRDHVAARLRAEGFPDLPLTFRRIGSGWIAVTPPRR
ncbi:hypothetical protein [Novosphingobium kaempferiae]|uniref:hypothetical protein n=1 Tax=Novosphingobium kaempferiae TaxID=2896849 RepID=UPI001E625142|nr:hypothetical protein [Novosphingobium kaempferiae]